MARSPFLSTILNDCKAYVDTSTISHRCLCSWTCPLKGLSCILWFLVLGYHKINTTRFEDLPDVADLHPSIHPIKL